MSIRFESDSVGTLPVPCDAYYGIQSLRAKENFPISGRAMHPAFLHSLTQIKLAAARANARTGQLPPPIADAICAACGEVLSGGFADQFPVDAIQGGAGTSANMNVNEVLANRAIELLGGQRGDYRLVHPNDHVNMSQSTNDTIPSAGKLTVLALLPALCGELEALADALLEKATAFDGILRIGRTQLQDAVPMRLGQGFHAYVGAIRRDIARLRQSAEVMHTLNLGGTAIGSGLNASPAYRRFVYEELCRITGLSLSPAEDLFDATQNLDVFAAFSGALKTCAMSLSKISNDLRLLSSGPRAGLGEIRLPARQNGSSIMPGKINPVIPEVVTQAAFRVYGNDLTVSLAAEAGQLELNAFEPVLFDALFESMQVLTGAVRTLCQNCIRGITANAEECQKHLDASVGVVTALCPYIGYKKAAALAKESLSGGVPIRDLVLRDGLLDPETLSRLLNPAAQCGGEG